jgi:catechol 2,3-dioxygenase-like lactoylglutathione lyase family enzyme
MYSPRVFLGFLGLLYYALASAQSSHVSVESIGMTVSDMDRAVEFYSALTFQKVSDVEVFGDEFEHLEGVFGARMRMVRMRLGSEYLDLTQYLAPPGRPIPVDSRSNDLWFQHAAIVVRDMDQAFEKLRALKVQFVSTGPQTLPPSIKAAAGISFLFSRPRRTQFGDHLFPTRERRSPLAGGDRQIVSRH